MLQGVVARGTARAIGALSPYVAGKTGTTEDAVDGWFIGFTNDVTIAVWVGYDNGDGKRRSLGANATGARVALPIFEPIIEAIWAEGIAPKAPLDGPSPEAQRHLVDLPIDYMSGNRITGGQERQPSVCSATERVNPPGKLSSSISGVEPMARSTRRNTSWFRAGDAEATRSSEPDEPKLRVRGLGRPRRRNALIIPGRGFQQIAAAAGGARPVRSRWRRRLLFRAQGPATESDGSSSIGHSEDRMWKRHSRSDTASLARHAIALVGLMGSLSGRERAGLPHRGSRFAARAGTWRSSSPA